MNEQTINRQWLQYLEIVRAVSASDELDSTLQTRLQAFIEARNIESLRIEEE